MAKTLKSRGAKEIFVGVTHGVLSKGAAARIADSEIKKMFITDTIENSFDPLPPNIEVVSVAHLFAAAIRSIHDRTSVSMLFPEK
jgi:ribose-phosphate pyrophosphokinase